MQRLHLAGKPVAAIGAPAPVQWADAHGVPGSTELPCGLVYKNTREDAVQAVPELVGVTNLLVKVADDGGIRLGVFDYGHALEATLGLDVVVVVDFAVPVRQAQGLVGERASGCCRDS